jgi:serine protease Do
VTTTRKHPHLHVLTTEAGNKRLSSPLHLVGAGFLFFLCVLPALAEEAKLDDAEARRIAAIELVRPAVVAVFARGGQGGGSGVLISPDGYALTNFHVTQGIGDFPQCGLADGELYDSVVVGIDPVGDVALIKLLPKEPGKPFPYATMGDSDLVQVGDWSLAMGNPFLLATDFTPTITMGIISGMHRYQYPAGAILEYTDCIQTEASINPGNSGGPLFNLKGEVIGINGRGSFEKRGRVNSGVGYAISINQIKNFLGHLRAGMVVDHATLGAAVKTGEDGQIMVTQILEESDAYRRGLRSGDEPLAFAGRNLTNVNQYKNVLGIYPRGWRLPLQFKSYGEDEKRSPTLRETLVRLQGVRPRELDESGRTRPRPRPGQPRPGQPQPQPGEPQPRPGEPQPRPGMPRPPEQQGPSTDDPVRKLHEDKTGYANFHFNRVEQDRLWHDFLRWNGNPAIHSGVWTITGERVRPIKATVEITIGDKVTVVKIGGIETMVEPLKTGMTPDQLNLPDKTGGLGVALYQWRRLLTQGGKGFEGEFTYGGYEPFYPTGAPASRVLTDVLNTEHAGFRGKWFFQQESPRLLGLESWLAPSIDPCEISFSDWREVQGVRMPHAFEVRHADKEIGSFVIQSYAFAPAVQEKK